ncbi:hypothetical protein BCY91_10930 [Pelobium manganitolerans]|uniref:DUF4249 domain-containing protein n=1 Tax=Pelobium manganitolerans TaxID=1842495 RepID=A0A419S368_9SPHI|nr:DUF4249 domain-containing protein [Pelobium manganitolerans]RKD13313.1 hypothetical protein BCY91_10930 [Pelobium manganitolerans]
MKTLKHLIPVVCLLAFFACKDAFTPEVEAKYKNLLVVEGFINIGEETTIRLSRTADLQDWQSIIPEKNAEVRIEGDQGALVQGTTDNNGRCVLQTQNLKLTEHYRLKLTDAKGKIYETDYLETKAAPEIDSVNYKLEGEGFRIYVNTHDQANKTRYYKWDYDETWEIRSDLKSYFEYKNGQVVNRDPNLNITYCWRNERSARILLGSTERLSEDRLTEMPINFVKGNAEKVAFTYSILVKQYGLTQQAYQYLRNIKKNTEQIGGIFDSQPSELKGNVYCVSDPQEQVLGWISAGSMTKKRLFITDKDKPIGRNWLYIRDCQAFNITKDSLDYYMNGNNGIVDNIGDRWLNIIGYVIGDNNCIDCRLRGSNIKPDYWPN